MSESTPENPIYIVDVQIIKNVIDSLDDTHDDVDTWGNTSAVALKNHIDSLTIHGSYPGCVYLQPIFDFIESNIVDNDLNVALVKTQYISNFRRFWI